MFNLKNLAKKDKMQKRAKMYIQFENSLKKAKMHFQFQN